MESKLPFEEKVKQNREAFLDRVRTISKQLGIRPEWLMLAMNIETAGTFRADSQNPMSHATGLIQFMPHTAISLGTTCDNLKSMTNVQQLDYVLKYMKTYSGKMNSFEDVYLSIFYPAAVGKPDSYQLGATAEMRRKIALQNSAYDQNKDAVVTKAEVKFAIRKFIPKGFEGVF